MAWDADSKEYVVVSIDTQSARVHRSSARWIDDTTFALWGEPFVYTDNKRYQFKRSWKLTPPDTYRELSEISLDGGETYLLSSNTNCKRG